MPSRLEWAGWLLCAGLLLVPSWPVASAFAPLAAVPPTLLLYTVPLMLVCGWVMAFDKVAGALGVYCILRALPFPPLAFETTAAVVAGIGLYGVALELPDEWDQPLRAALLTAGVFVVGFQAGEYLLYQVGLIPHLIGGGIGNTNFVGAFVAITGALAPTVALPLFAVGVALSGSILAGMAFGAAMVWRFRAVWWTWASAVSLLLAVVCVRGSSLTSWAFRWSAWTWGATAWAQAPLLGHGPGFWERAGVVVSNATKSELLLQAHNDWLQIGVEYGLVGLGLLLFWCWHRRSAWTVPTWGPALPAIVVSMAAMMPLHIPAIAAAVSVVLGRATRRTA